MVVTTDAVLEAVAKRVAEFVLGLERLSHSFARLRILKDRDGDLTVAGGNGRSCLHAAREFPASQAHTQPPPVRARAGRRHRHTHAFRPYAPTHPRA